MSGVFANEYCQPGSALRCRAWHRLLAFFRRLDVEHFQRQRRSGQRGDIRLVVCRCHFHNIHTDDVQILNAAQQFQRAIGGQAANHRRAGARCERRIQAVDVERQVYRHVADNLFHLCHHIVNGAVVHLRRVQHGKAVVFVELGTNTNLHRAGRIDQAFVRRGVEHGAVVKFTAVGVGIGMRVEMHQRHFTEVLRVGAQQRQRHEVVTAEREHTLTGRQQFFRVRLEFLAHLARIAERVNQIAAVHDVQALTHIEVPREAVAFPREVGGYLTNSGRSEAAARTARGGHIKRNTGDHPLGVAVIRHEIQRQA
ncbi:hypothetical protein ESA_00404 [Cronobacter sakazakii ATCC BAA-894]|uniref:Uncharacterized protein n=1 Tax=Cronobacter sakazakii (strain ATCC BAA-894) TaxID=290339 RepID=A7MJQ3_CROS8|nr:hypothetical protein ESA_00404 [Cronobacter sakazakii ATCC BAA-894]